MRLRHALRARELRWKGLIKEVPASFAGISRKRAGNYGGRCVEERMGNFLVWKTQQASRGSLATCCWSKRDASVNLPTGFGKSVVLQALSVQGHPTTVYCKISQSEKQILPRIMYYFIYEIRYNFLKFNLAISHFTRQVRLFFIKKKRKPKIFGFKNMMERGIRKILSFVMHPVNSSCAQSPPLPRAGGAFFFCLDSKFSGLGTLELSNPQGWGRNKRANALSSVNTATFFIDRTIE